MGVPSFPKHEPQRPLPGRLAAMAEYGSSTQHLVEDRPRGLLGNVPDDCPGKDVRRPMFGGSDARPAQDCRHCQANWASSGIDATQGAAGRQCGCDVSRWEGLLGLLVRAAPFASVVVACRDGLRARTLNELLGHALQNVRQGDGCADPGASMDQPAISNDKAGEAEDDCRRVEGLLVAELSQFAKPFRQRQLLVSASVPLRPTSASSRLLGLCGSGVSKGMTG